MKKKSILFLLVLFGGLFILLYNPLNKLGITDEEIGEVHAAGIEEFLRSSNGGTYTLTSDETLSNYTELNFDNETSHTINLNNHTLTISAHLEWNYNSNLTINGGTNRTSSKLVFSSN